MPNRRVHKLGESIAVSCDSACVLGTSWKLRGRGQFSLRHDLVRRRTATGEAARMQRQGRKVYFVGHVKKLRCEFLP